MDATNSTQVQDLYKSLLAAWNANDAQAFAAQFAPNCLCVGFDGTTYTSADQIAVELGKIFADHQVASYVHKVRDITALDPTTALLHAVASMTPPGSTQVNPERNAVQAVLARKDASQWRIVLFQNTPAKYDGRPDAVQALTDELQRLVKKGSDA